MKHDIIIIIMLSCDVSVYLMEGHYLIVFLCVNENV